VVAVSFRKAVRVAQAVLAVHAAARPATQLPQPTVLPLLSNSSIHLETNA